MHTMRSVALFDLDKTLCEGFSYFGLLEQQVGEGIIDAPVLVQAKEALDSHASGKADYENSIARLLDIYAFGLRGRSYDQVLASTVNFYASTPTFYDYAPFVFDLLRPTHDSYLITGEPQFVAQAVVKQFRLNGYRSTEYEVNNGIFTGGVKRYLAARDEKHNAVSSLLSRYDPSRSLAFGDSDGDIEMLNDIKHPLCINPSPGLSAHAGERGWSIVEPESVLQAVEDVLATVH